MQRCDTAWFGSGDERRRSVKANPHASSGDISCTSVKRCEEVWRCEEQRSVRGGGVEEERCAARARVQMAGRALVERSSAEKGVVCRCRRAECGGWCCAAVERAVAARTVLLAHHAVPGVAARRRRRVTQRRQPARRRPRRRARGSGLREAVAGGVGHGVHAGVPACEARGMLTGAAAVAGAGAGATAAAAAAAGGGEGSGQVTGPPRLGSGLRRGRRAPATLEGGGT